MHLWMMLTWMLNASNIQILILLETISFEKWNKFSWMGSNGRVTCFLFLLCFFFFELCLKHMRIFSMRNPFIDLIYYFIRTLRYETHNVHTSGFYFVAVSFLQKRTSIFIIVEFSFPSHDGKYYDTWCYTWSRCIDASIFIVFQS